MKKNYAEHVVRGTALIFTATLATNIISYVIRIFLARSLTPEEFGLVYAAISFVALINIFQNFGLGQTLQKKIPEFIINRNYGKIKYAMKFSFSIQFTYAVIVFIFILLFSQQIADNIFRTSQAVPVLIVLSILGLVHVANQVVITSLQGLHRIKIYTALNFFNYIFRFIFVLLLIPLGVLALPYSQLAATAVFAVIGVLVFRVKFPEIIAAKPQPISRELIAFSTPIIAILIASTINANFSTVMLSSLRSLGDVAMYQIALPIANIVMILAGSIAIIALPLTSELWAKHNMKQLRRIIELLLKALFAVVIPMVIIFITFPELVIGMLFGESYLQANGILQLLSVAVIFQSLVMVSSSLLLGIGDTRTLVKIAFLITATNVITSIVLIPTFGIMGAAMSLLVTYVVGTFAHIYASRKRIKFRFQTANITKIFFGGLISTSIIFLLKTSLVINPWIELFIAIPAGLIFYFVYIIKTRTITRREMKLMFDAGLPIPGQMKKIILKFMD